MNIQERYDDISKISGLSEDILRRAFKATRQSLIKSLKQGERATVPGICTILPDIRQRLNIGGTLSSYIKVKASPSQALAAELEKYSEFEVPEQDEDTSGDSKLNLVNPEIPRYEDIRTSQISALL